MTTVEPKENIRVAASDGEDYLQGIQKVGRRHAIAHVSPLAVAVPPNFYGGTESVVSGLTGELVREGQEVTLFAIGDCTAKLFSAVPMR